MPFTGGRSVPAPGLIAAVGEQARSGYLQAAYQFFAWCEERGLELREIRPLQCGRSYRSKTARAPRAFIIPPPWQFESCNPELYPLWIRDRRPSHLPGLAR